MAVRALLWTKDPLREHAVCCQGCARYCRVAEGKTGVCRVRVNKGGVLFSLSSDHVATVNVDPVEKKPLFHFLPGTTTLSLGTPGCTMQCAFCQNHDLSLGRIPAFFLPGVPLTAALSPGVLAACKTASAASVSFTYNEPTVSPELIAALAPAVLEAGLATILVSNGFVSKEGMAMLRPLVLAVNFDLKAFSDEFYRKVCGARLAPVLRTLAEAVSFGWWVEVTTLLIPGHNDSDAELTALAQFIKEELGPHVPWHISRFRPMHKMTDLPPTPVSSLERARAIGLAEGLFFVYTGNVHGHEGEHTFCPTCGGVVIQRCGYRATVPDSFACGQCGHTVPGVWSAPLAV